ncbi:MAG: Na+/galactose cotransporter [Terracidiphilus sp.]
MPNLASSNLASPGLAAVDSLILLIYFFFMLAAGFSLKPAMTTSTNFMQAGRAMPGWLCSLAMLGASLGSLEVLGMGAAGAQYGLASVAWFMLGSTPAMLFAGLYLMPIFYSSRSVTAAADAKATSTAPRSIPEYLGLRFDQKTRVLNAIMFAAMSAFSAGIALYAMARGLIALHVFDRISESLNLPPTGTLLLAMAFPAALVLAYILLGGLGAAMYNQALQFLLIIAGLLPMVLLGLKKIGGWSGLKAQVPANLLDGLTQMAPGSAHSEAHSMGAGIFILVVGLVLGGATWCTDFRLLQMPMAAKDVQSARRAPINAAAARIFVPLVLVLPGLIAVGLPTPHTSILVFNDNNVISHEITVVPPAVEAGTGLVPARADASGMPVIGPDGHAVLDYLMATPNVLPEFLPTGLLGLGIAALLACLMAGVAASVTSFSTVFTCDIFQALFAKNSSDKRLLIVARFAAAGGMLLAFAAACATVRFSSLLDAILLVFAVVNVPLFAVLMLGAFFKRVTRHGAFAGLIAGAAAAVLDHGLALQRDAKPGIHGGWMAVLHHPASEIALNLEIAILAFAVSLLVTILLSAFTSAKPESELNGLVYSLTTRPPTNAKWWKQPEAMAVAVLLAAIAVNLILI